MVAEAFEYYMCICRIIQTSKRQILSTTMAASNEGHEPPKKKQKIIKSINLKTSTDKRLIIILEKASLESVKVGKVFELMNCDKHGKLIKKFKKDISQYRPDITHQCLLMLMDSPLNRAGLLQVYIHTEKNVLIEINPQTRIPRTFDRFCGLMVQLLHKLSIQASDGPQKLLKVIKNPITDHLPIGCKKVGTSFQADVCNIKDLVPENEPIVFVIGAIAHGKIEPDYVENTVSISNYPLSAALTCSKLCNAFEEKWGIV